jgi:hypothetical protein
MNFFARMMDLTKLLWAGKQFYGFGEFSHSIVGRDGVDFGGVKLWK